MIGDVPNLSKRKRFFYQAAKTLGYAPASYISHAFVGRDVELGEQCFIFENNVLQPRAKARDERRAVERHTRPLKIPQGGTGRVGFLDEMVPASRSLNPNRSSR